MADPASRLELEATRAPDALQPMAEAAAPPRTWSQIAWRRFRQHKVALVAVGVLILFYLSAFLAPVIAPFEFDELNLDRTREPPSLDHLMGTDALGRDEFSRVLFGGRISLLVGVAVALSAGVIGTAVGALAGYHGGWLDNLLMRVTDFFLAMPLLVVLIMAAHTLGGSIPSIVTILALFFWMPLARVIRGVFLSLKEKEYIEAARASGASASRLILRHMLPNAMGPIVVYITLAIAQAILTESLISFLGFGIQPPTPTWGNMVSESKDALVTQPWLVWFPGLMILITVMSVNFLGDGLRDALDPTQRRTHA